MFDHNDKPDVWLMAEGNEFIVASITWMLCQVVTWLPHPTCCNQIENIQRTYRDAFCCHQPFTEMRQVMFERHYSELQCEIPVSGDFLPVQ